MLSVDKNPTTEMPTVPEVMMMTFFFVLMSSRQVTGNESKQDCFARPTGCLGLRLFLLYLKARVSDQLIPAMKSYFLGFWGVYYNTLELSMSFVELCL